jgi:hypothetical protein
MIKPERFDKLATGIIAGLVLPLMTALIIYLFSKGDPSIAEWIRRISMVNMETNIITLCVFPNVLIFFLFNYFDMLKAVKGVLGITIVWALVVFLIRVIQ